MKLPNYVLTCLQQLNQNGYEAFIVGGAVRNILIGFDTVDYDVTTNATPEQVKTCFNDYKIIETGIKHGTVTLFIEENPIEITTYRLETTYTDFRHPDQIVYSGSLQEDCMRRDFTINALCYNPESGLIDFYNGYNDLKSKTIRCIGNPDQRFNEDALRILRAIRLSAQLDFSIDQNTSNSIIKNRYLLKHISIERIQNELCKMFLSENCANQIFTYKSVFDVFIPEFIHLNDYPKKLNKTFEALSNSIPSIPLRMACLLHQLDEVDLLYTAQNILTHLKFSNILKKQILQLLRTIYIPLTNKIEVKLCMKEYFSDFDNIIYFKKIVDPNFDDKYALSLVHEILDNHECYTLPQLDINGLHLKKLGYRGTQLSAILNDCLNQVIYENINNTFIDISDYISKNYNNFK